MKVIRYHSPEGQRSGLLVSTGTKFHHVILIDNQIRVHKIPVSEESWFTDVQLNGNPYPVARAVKHFRNIVRRYHGGMRNVSKDENIDPNAQWFGGGVVIEHRYVEDILEGILNSGLEVVT